MEYESLVHIVLLSSSSLYLVWFIDLFDRKNSFFVDWTALTDSNAGTKHRAEVILFFLLLFFFLIFLVVFRLDIG